MDANYNGIDDSYELPVNDANYNGIDDAFEVPINDANGNGIDDSLEWVPPAITDTNWNGIDDSLEWVPPAITDTNWNGIDDALEVPPAIVLNDTNFDGIDDALQAVGVDVDFDGIDDGVDLFVPVLNDGNLNGIDDSFEAVAAAPPVLLNDADFDGIDDSLELVSAGGLPPLVQSIVAATPLPSDVGGGDLAAVLADPGSARADSIAGAVAFGNAIVQSGNLDMHPALAAIDANTIQSTITDLTDFTRDFAASHGFTASGLPTAARLDSIANSPSIFSPLGQFRAAFDPFGVVRANLDTPTGRLGPLGDILFDDNGVIRPLSLGVFGPEAAFRPTLSAVLGGDTSVPLDPFQVNPAWNTADFFFKNQV